MIDVRCRTTVLAVFFLKTNMMLNPGPGYLKVCNFFSDIFILEEG